MMFRFTSMFLLSALILQGCQFDLSPWETDVHCPGMDLESNIEALAELEKNSPERSSFKVAVMGDPQQYPGDFEISIGAINEKDDVDFILLLGDLAETGVEKEFEWACKALSKAEKPVLVVVGNHDLLSYGRQIWLKVFGELNYSFHYKGVKFIGYDDNQYESRDAPDREWLAESAALEPGEERRYTIGMSHIEPWGNDPNLGEYLKALGFDHMLHAHNHRFNYYQKANVGLPHFITADTRDIKFGIMTVADEGISMEQCDPHCVPVDLRTH